MDRTTRTGSPLRQRMIEDMRMRKLEPRTQEGYIRAVRKLTVFLERSPDTATVEDLRKFQLHLVDTGTSPITLNATLTGLKFFFDITLGRGELMARMQPVKLPRTVPVVLSMQEAAANASRKVSLAAARQFLAVPLDITPVNDGVTAANDEPAAKPPSFECRHCGRPMAIVMLLAPERSIRAPPRKAAR